MPEVIDVLPYFNAPISPITTNGRLKIHTADARRYVNASTRYMDVIVADLFHPARDGAGFLYTIEHFTAIRSLLNPDWIFCQWLPLYQMDLGVLRIIIRTFMQVFPHGKAVLATYSLQTPIIGLIASKDDALYKSNFMSHRVNDDALLRKLASLRLTNTYSLFGAFIASSRDLIDFAGPGPLNTDDLPIVIFKAPRFLYCEKDRNGIAYERPFSLLDYFHPSPEDILQPDPTKDRKDIYKHLKAYWSARDKFLHLGIGVKNTGDVDQMLAQIKAPLLAIVRESPDFEAAYNPLLAMAIQLNRINPEAARGLLLELQAADPIRQDAKELLNQMGANF